MSFTRKQKQCLAWTAAAFAFGVIAHFAPHRAAPLPVIPSAPMSFAESRSCADFVLQYREQQQQLSQMADHPMLLVWGGVVVCAGLWQLGELALAVLRWLGRGLRVGLRRLLLFCRSVSN